MKLFRGTLVDRSPATVADLNALAPLFDAHRQFYMRPSDESRAWSFLSDRFEYQQSIILVACNGSEVAGFTPLFPSFSSVELTRTFVLNDLYVLPSARGTGASLALLDAACDCGRSVVVARLSLSTSVSNTTVHSFYE